MKKKACIVALLLCAAAPTFVSCTIGSYACFNKVNDFNTNLTSNKYVNGIVGWFLAPIDLGIAGFIDVVICNTLEFWSGSNPMAATQVVTGEDGNHYAIASDKQGGYIVTCQETNKQVNYLFNQYTHTWSIESDGQTVQLFSMVDPNTISINNADGTTTIMPLNAENLMALK